MLAVIAFVAIVGAVAPDLPFALDLPPALDLQVRLDRAGFSPGQIDGRTGRNTKQALAAFQRANRLGTTREPDAATLDALNRAAPGDTVVSYQVTAEDVAGPFIPAIPEDMVEKANLPALGFTSALELISERWHSSPQLIEALNPGVAIAEGATLRVPNVRPTQSAPEEPSPSSVRVSVSKSGRDLTVTSEDGKVLFYAPVTVGSENDPLPIGEWKVTAVQKNPVFHYNPDLFWDADPSHAKAKIPAGPNSPVGVVWIDLSKPHYGIHGTPEPAQIGRTESHGCVRLTNWDAMSLAALVRPGTTVLFEP